MLSLVLGLATGLMLVLPFVKVFGLPLAYVMTFGIFVHGMASSKKLAPESGRLLIFLLPAAYIFFAGFLFGKVDPISTTFRNAIFMMAALNILRLLTDRHEIDQFLVGLGAVAFVNSSVAIMQYHDVEGVRIASLLFLQLHDAGDLIEQFIESTGLRVFGLQPAPHIFAYTSSFLTSIFLLALVIYKSGARLMIPLLIVLSLFLAYSVFLSAQRTAFWPLLIPFGYISYRLVLRSHSKLIGVFFVFMLSALLIWQLSSDEAFDESIMARLFEGVGGTSADSVRSSTWDAAFAFISADPWFGTAYHSGDLEVGIHNALLNGWAMLGIFWLLFFTFPFIGFAFRSLYRKNLPQRIVAVSILAIIFLNMMFHSYVPTLNDVVFYIALSMLIVLQKFAKEVS